MRCKELNVAIRVAGQRRCHVCGEYPPMNRHEAVRIRHNAVVLATFVYLAANHDQPLPRKTAAGAAQD